MGKQSLGRGLSAIFHDHALPASVEPDTEGTRIIKIPLTQIDPNPFQPRRQFDEAEIQELAETILEHGLIQPITVRKHSGRYQIVSGERRTRAAKLAGYSEIEARVHDKLSDKSMMEWAIIENIQRVDLNPMEVAISYHQLLDNHGYTHDDLAKRLGKSRSAITNSVRLLKLPESVQQWVAEGKLSAGAARTLISPDISDPEKAALAIMEGGMNVRQAESLAKPKNTPSAKAAKEVAKLDPHYQQIVQDLQYALGTRVRLQGKGKDLNKGAILVEYESMQDLVRIRDFMSQQNQG